MRWLSIALLVMAVAAVPAEPQPGPAAERLLVSLSGEHRVTLVDPNDGRVVRTFPAVLGPHEIAVSRDGRVAYVANAGEGPTGKPGMHVTAIDLRAANATQITVAPHEKPHDVRVSRDSRLLWVAAAPSRLVLEIDAATGRQRRALEIGADGGWFVIATPDDRTLYVPLLEGKGLVRIDVASGDRRTVVAGGAFSGTDVRPDGREVWALEHEKRRIVILSTADDTNAGQVDLPSDTFGRLQFTPDGHRLLLVQDRTLLEIDVATRRIARTVDMPRSGKVLAIARSARMAAISNPADDAVTVVDLPALRIARSIKVGRTPDGVAWVD